MTPVSCDTPWCHVRPPPLSCDGLYSVSGGIHRLHRGDVHICNMANRKNASNESVCRSTFRRALKLHLNIRCGSGTLHFVPAHLLARKNTHRQTSTHIHTLSSRRRKPGIWHFKRTPAAVAIATARPSQLLQPAQRGGGADAATCRRPKLAPAVKIVS